MERKLAGKSKVIGAVFAAILSLFILYTTVMGVLPDMQQRSLYLLMAIPLTFIMFPFRASAKEGTGIPLWELVLIAFAIVACLNVFLNHERFIREVGKDIRTFDLVLGIGVTLLILDGARRTIGWAFPIMTLLFILYGLFGPYFPGIFKHRGISLGNIVSGLYMADQGLWGFVTGIGVGIVGVFLIFGASLAVVGAAQVIYEMACIIAGRWIGGAAQVVCVGDMFVGMITGSSTANVAMTGVMTIPAMKKLKYPAAFAGGVESATSTAGQFTPPVMGAGAFIMAELLGISYFKVIVAAILPALLFFLGTMAAIRFEAVRLKLAPLAKEDIPPIRGILKWDRLGPLVIPLFVLFGVFFAGYSITLSCFCAILAIVVLYVFSSLSLGVIRQRVIAIPAMLVEGGKMVVAMTPLLICANIVITLVGMTGLGVKFSVLVTNLAAHSLVLSLILGAVTTLILGMGIPTTGAYVVAASVIWPVLSRLGVQELPGNLFLFIFACLSAITPPVCAAVYVAAPIAQANWVKVAWVAIKLSLAAYIIPFLFVYNPELILQGGSVGSIIFTALTALVGIVFIAAGVWGQFHTRLNPFARIISFTGGVMLLAPHFELSLYGLAVLAAGFIVDTIYRRRSKPAQRLKPVS